MMFPSICWSPICSTLFGSNTWWHIVLPALLLWSVWTYVMQGCWWHSKCQVKLYLTPKGVCLPVLGIFIWGLPRLLYQQVPLWELWSLVSKSFCLVVSTHWWSPWYMLVGLSQLFNSLDCAWSWSSRIPLRDHCLQFVTSLWKLVLLYQYVITLAM